MAILVQKFGGTSVGAIENLNNVAKIIQRTLANGDQSAVVVSAMGKTTNKLIKQAKEANPNPQPRELDALVSTGEIVSAATLAMVLDGIGIKACSLSAWQMGIKTDGRHQKARITEIDTSIISKLLEQNIVPVIAGFQGVGQFDGIPAITTLGRGNSDTTAVAIAAGLKADRCVIYTDVAGVYSADPRIVPKARKLHTIRAEEMLEMASSGAKVLHPRSVMYAWEYQIDLEVRSSLTDEPGTLIISHDIV